MPKVSEKLRSRIWSLQTQIGKGILDGTHNPEKYADILQAFLEKKETVCQGLTTMEQAVNILGSNKVISETTALEVWGLEKNVNVPIRYSEATLRQCAQENEQDKADWRLIYCHGFSLREQFEKHGYKEEKQPCFRLDLWWLRLKEEDDKWVNYKPLNGYYLLNLYGLYGYRSKTKLIEIALSEISKSSKEYEPCNEAIFSEAILTIYMVNNGERIAEDWYHCGGTKNSFDRWVIVGAFKNYGILINHYKLFYYYPNVKIVLVKKFEI